MINFGNELLIGRIVNTNGAWLAEQLTLLGFDVRRIIVAPDDEEAVEVLREALSKADVIVCTGGLGPTYDDRTAEFLAKAVGRRLVENGEALEMVRRKYEERGLPLTPERRKMALLPEGSKPIPNPVGTAPGIMLEVDGRLAACLPGVPAEMKEMFERYVKPVLRERAPNVCIYEASIVVEGVPESTLAPVIKEVARSCPPPCYVKSHPKGHEVRAPVLDIRVMGSARNCEEAEAKVREGARRLREEAVRHGGRVLEERVYRLGD